MQQYDLVIIGGGPTGLNCAIAAAREGLNYIVLEKGMLANSIYHFPDNMTFFSTSKKLEIGGVPFISHTDKPTRREALEYYRRIQQTWGIPVRTYEPVVRMEQHPDGGYLIHSSRQQYRAHSVVVSTGFYDTPNLMQVPGEELPKVKHYYDDAHPYIGQRVLVVGAANSACQTALELWRKGAEVSMAIRGNDIYKGVKYWIKPDIENRIKEGSISAYFNTRVKAIHTDDVVLEGPEGAFRIANDWVMAMTGYQPNYGLLQKLGLEVSPGKERIPAHDAANLESANLPNVYLAGVLCAGMETNRLFIENTRGHGEIIARQIASRAGLQPA
ncbi:YpdA family putative bacillithiol disulfide reductase [Phaeodactylibacter luteus]|uniref:YpdA family putative bacillithiol disulfide reductase n=1 Tax=Phaeodactylibacter luteus TaxID=1564516 RepID=A0A5C6S788_9BACT|nr:YpdA family putative bacillithiol disulfide reductase [Phaeodactylibacter luteus]TXB70197.1 YpdA family putative bacillithiol disulfide reductase [Phaeodactylibacter luteus]